MKAGEKPVFYVLADDSVVTSKWQYPKLNVVFATETLEEMALKIQVAGIELKKIIYDEYPLMSQEQIQILTQDRYYVFSVVCELRKIMLE